MSEPLVWVEELDEDVEVIRSLLSYTIRTPNALIPSGDVNGTRLLDVLLSLESVANTAVGLPGSGSQVQNSVDQISFLIVGAHERVMSPEVGQQVTVVMLLTPNVS